MPRLPPDSTHTGTVHARHSSHSVYPPPPRLGAAIESCSQVEGRSSSSALGTARNGVGTHLGGERVHCTGKDKTRQDEAGAGPSRLPSVLISPEARLRRPASARASKPSSSWWGHSDAAVGSQAVTAQQQAGATRRMGTGKPSKCHALLNCASYGCILMLLAVLVSMYWLWPRDVSLRVINTAVALPTAVLVGSSTEITMILNVGLRVTNDNYLPLLFTDVSATTYHDVPLTGVDSLLGPTPIARIKTVVAQPGVKLPARGSTVVAVQARISTSDGGIINVNAAKACALSLSTGGSCPLSLELTSAPKVLGWLPVITTSVKVPIEVRLTSVAA